MSHFVKYNHSFTKKRCVIINLFQPVSKQKHKNGQKKGNFHKNAYAQQSLWINV